MYNIYIYLDDALFVNLLFQVKNYYGLHSGREEGY